MSEDATKGTSDAASRGDGIFTPRSQAQTASHVTPAVLTGVVQPPGTQFGRYKIVRLLGSGGMGAVYEAQQDSPRRNVALKVIRASYLSPQLLRRFENESQVLGRLQHPGIAQVYEAGSVRDERGETVPFFAMELIKGVPLTGYAAAKDLGTRERLELVARLCDAVSYAHQKSVIHRDLKPGNILVDESGQPKILDFGVARATDSDVQQTTMQTDIGELIGTVPYMSPEQVGGDPDDLDTRSDVYALGVIAYELLAGRLPYDLQKKMIHEAVRAIREDEPARLSSIDRALRGDVETIVRTALEKDKARRYQSAEALGSDIRRHLKNEPIAARPTSIWYRAAKYAQRNKAVVRSACLTVIVGLAGAIWAWAESQRADDNRMLFDSQAANVEADFKLAAFERKFERELGLASPRSDSQTLADRFAMLESVLLKTYADLVSSVGEAHHDTRDCAKALASLYDAWDQVEPDQGFDRKAADLRAKAGDETRPEDP